MTKYHMQKSEREITDPDIIEQVLKDGKFLTLALCHQNQPYILTLNFGYDAMARNIYFHTAKQGLKLMIIRENPVVCGTIIEDHGYIAEVCSHAYRSVIFTGKIEILDDLTAKKRGFDVMLNHLEKEPDNVKKRLLARDEAYDNVVIMRLKIDEITGKEGNVS